MINTTYKDIFVGGQMVAKKTVLERLEETGIIDNIMKHDVQRKGRDRETVAEHCSRGLACEVGIAIITNGELNPAAFNYRDRDSYGWDVKCGITGAKLEIKNHQHKWWSYSPKNVQTLAKNIAGNVFDYIVTAKMEEKDDGYVIWPRLVIDPKSFRQYSTRSKWFGLYYNHQTAMHNNDCLQFNESIISVQTQNNVL